MRVRGPHRYVGPHGVDVDSTAEDFTVTIDPVGGTDPDDGLRYNTQAQFTALGDFASVGGALNALPDQIAHEVTLEHADGVFTVSDLGDWSRFMFSKGGRITLTSASEWTRVSGTTSYAVASAVGSPTNEVTLTADPSFSSNLVRGAFMHVLSGTGAGEYYAVRYHSGAVFGHAGRFTDLPDATSTVEFMEPAVTFEIADNVAVKGIQNPQDYLVAATDIRSIRFLGVAVETTVAEKTLVLQSLDVLLEKFRFKGSFGSSDSRVEIETGVFDADGDAIAFRSVGGYTRTGGNEASLLIRGSAFIGILVDNQTAAGGGDSFFNFHKGAVDDCSGGYIWFVQNNARVRLGGSNVVGTGNTGYFLTVDSGGRALLGSLATPPSGSLGDINLDGTPVTYAQINADPDKSAMGVRGSVAQYVVF